MTKRKIKRQFGSAAPIHLENARIADISAYDAASAAADFADNAAYGNTHENCAKATERLERTAYWVGRATADRIGAGDAATPNNKVNDALDEAHTNFSRNCLK